MKLSRTVTYAIQAAIQLVQAGPGATIPCSKLAAEGEMPERFLLQILRTLVSHGILRSTRGVDGGYSLDRDPDSISLLDVIEAIDGPLSSGTNLAESLPTESKSRLRAALTNVADSTRRELEAIRLSQLVPPPKRKQNSG
jgi:Rrf2 family protein